MRDSVSCCDQRALVLTVYVRVLHPRIDMQAAIFFIDIVPFKLGWYGLRALLTKVLLTAWRATASDDEDDDEDDGDEEGDPDPIGFFVLWRYTPPFVALYQLTEALPPALGAHARKAMSYLLVVRCWFRRYVVQRRKRSLPSSKLAVGSFALPPFLIASTIVFLAPPTVRAALVAPALLVITTTECALLLVFARREQAASEGGASDDSQARGHRPG